MSLIVKSTEAERLAQELAAITGESVSDAVVNALRERLDRASKRRREPQLADKLRALREECRRLPVLDNRSPDELMDYDENGLPR